MASVTPGLATLAGEAVTPARFAFTTGGPAIKRSVPYEGAAIDENQVFILALDAPATDASIEANVWCGAEGIGERIGVRVLQGDEKAQILANRALLGDRFRGWERSSRASRIAGAAWRRGRCGARCERGGGASRLGQGGGDGRRHRDERDESLAFQVRRAFSASLRCTRVNAQARASRSCRWSSGLARRSPARGRADRAPRREWRDHKARLPEGNAPSSTRFPSRRRCRAHEVPGRAAAGLKDDAGRQLANAASFPLATATTRPRRSRSSRRASGSSS